MLLRCTPYVLTSRTVTTVQAAAAPAAAPRQDTEDLNPAMNEPDKFAWMLFVEINKPARAGAKDRVWERWALDEDIFANPNVTPAWPDAGFRDTQQPTPKRLRPITQLQLALQEARVPRRRAARRRGRAPEAGFVPRRAGVGEEVRMNKATFEHIVDNNLWYVEGQEAAFAKGAKIDFPVESKEVKAVWEPITEAQKPRFYWQLNTADGKTYGLVALHIITKDLPNWTWATFEQVDNPDRCKQGECRDAFGLTPDGQQPSPALLTMMRNAGLGREWEYYRLNGAQTEFTDSTGRPTLLGNSVIESGFVSSSSCITCHARATIGARNPNSPRANRLSVFKSSPPPISDNGTPDPRWFYTDPNNPATRKYLQLDFLWSLFRAKRRTQ